MRSRLIAKGAFLTGAITLGALAFGCSGGGAGAALFQENEIAIQEAPDAADPGTQVVNPDVAEDSGPLIVPPTEDAGTPTEDASVVTDATTVDADTRDAADDVKDAAIDVRTDGPKSCGGSRVGPGCWYLGATGASCTATCKAGRGGFDFQTTLGYVGGLTNADNCANVFEAVSGKRAPALCGLPAADPPVCRMAGKQSCAYQPEFGPGLSALWVNGTLPPTPDASYPGMERVCACNK